MKQALFLLTVLAFVPQAQPQLENLDMMGLINTLYLKVDLDLDGTITSNEMNKLWDTMDSNGDGQVNSTEFTRVWQQLTNYSLEITNAYFFMADLDGNGVLDAKDDAAVFVRFDLNGDGLIQAHEFLTKYTQIYHEVPFVVLFERVERANNYDQHVTQHEFSQLLQSLSTSADGSVRKDDFEKEWTSSRFGSLKDADDVFASLDSDKNGVITISEVDAKFLSLDVNGNGTLEILEVIGLAKTAG